MFYTLSIRKTDESVTMFLIIAPQTMQENHEDAASNLV